MKLKSDLLTVLQISVLSRAFYILIAYGSSKLFEPYDKSTLLVENSFFSFLLRWDAIHFYTVARGSYSVEHITAFFPLYPLLISFISKYSGIGTLLLGIIISNTCFCISALVLYCITIRRYPRNVSLASASLFCFNPASIVYSTLYSESLFTLLFLTGFLLLELKLPKSIFFFSLCNLTRSNGVLFALFPIFNTKLVYLVPSLFLQLFPFGLFQLCCFWMLGRREIYIPYSYIQEKYWEQGFLRFYLNPKNIPNLLVALPFISFSLYLLFSYAQSCRKKDKNTIVLMIILFLQTLVAIFLIHPQIFFRFVSFNPIIYWSLAYMIRKETSNMRYVITFYLTFSVAYAILFGAYYPPT